MSVVSGVENLNLDCYDFLSLKNSLKKGERSTIRLTPISGDNVFSFNSNRVIMFDIPYIKGAFWDLKNTTFQTGARSTGTAPTSSEFGTAFNNFFESVINRLQIFLADGSSEVETINYYNLKANSLLKYKISQDYNNTIALQQWGVADEATRLKWASGRDYAVNLIGSGFLSSPMKYIPLNLLAKNNYSRSLRIEITLENPELCMFGDVGTTRNYELSNVFLQMDIVSMPEYNKELEMKINSGQMRLPIPYCTSHTWQNQLLTGAVGRQNFSIQEYKQYVTGIMTLFKGSSTISQEYTSNFTNPNLTNYQWKLNDKYYPTREITMKLGNGVAPSYNELLKYFNKIKMYSESTTGSSSSNQNVLTAKVRTNNSTDVLETNTVSAPKNLLNGGTPLSPSRNFHITVPSSLINITFDGAQSIISVNRAGFYNVTMITEGRFYNITSPDTFAWTTEMFVLTGASTYTSVNVHFYTRFVQSVLAAPLGLDSPQSTSTLSGVVYLEPNKKYIMGSYLNGTVDVASAVSIASFYLTMSLETASSAADTTDFVLGQQLRNFYDMDDHLQNMSEYLLDGVDVSTSSTFNINIGSPLSESVQMYHFVDYTSAIVIDDEKVIIIN